MTLSLIILLAVALDYWLGEPGNAYHPLVVFGRWSKRLENRYLNLNDSAIRQRFSGILALVLALLPSLAWLGTLAMPSLLETLSNVLTLYFCIAARSLQQHAQAVRIVLQTEDLPFARLQVGKIVSRQTEKMTLLDVRRATIESVLENGADALFAPLFWFVLLGPFGAVLYRLSNTLDAMWGYKNTRYNHFGWASARFDDLLNYIPSRLTALSYAVLGNTSSALQAWRYHAPKLESPNAGPVMAAGAGSLNLQLGGPAWYHGQHKDKPWFGGVETPQDTDIDCAVRLVYQALCLWLVLIFIGESLA
ncbi:adenosylcobinamide-phosphate synthase CbiB [Methylobacter luteus]|uniref:adenosylcobinamide-phosphate synthase CbiB n=1 Tax=Methylobacter luteus TaxID=415 RepID=UPI0003FAC5F5|nr:adenosylcobinamide-phosphate synthase CbiB [Methylobacter luteus]